VFSFLGTHQYAGAAADEIQTGLRKFPVGMYIVYYRVAKCTIKIVHVFHAKRNQRKALRRSGL
jgi:plasmid stabilization system protein ParE